MNIIFNTAYQLENLINRGFAKGQCDFIFTNIRAFAKLEEKGYDVRKTLVEELLPCIYFDEESRAKIKEDPDEMIRIIMEQGEEYEKEKERYVEQLMKKDFSEGVEHFNTTYIRCRNKIEEFEKQISSDKSFNVAYILQFRNYLDSFKKTAKIISGYKVFFRALPVIVAYCYEKLDGTVDGLVKLTYEKGFSLKRMFREYRKRQKAEGKGYVGIIDNRLARAFVGFITGYNTQREEAQKDFDEAVDDFDGIIEYKIVEEFKDKGKAKRKKRKKIKMDELALIDVIKMHKKNVVEEKDLLKQIFNAFGTIPLSYFRSIVTNNVADMQVATVDNLSEFVERKRRENHMRKLMDVLDYRFEVIKDKLGDELKDEVEKCSALLGQAEEFDEEEKELKKRFKKSETLIKTTEKAINTILQTLKKIEVEKRELEGSLGDDIKEEEKRINEEYEKLQKEEEKKIEEKFAKEMKKAKGIYKKEENYISMIDEGDMGGLKGKVEELRKDLDNKAKTMKKYQDKKDREAAKIKKNLESARGKLKTALATRENIEGKKLKTKAEIKNLKKAIKDIKNLEKKISNLEKKKPLGPNDTKRFRNATMAFIKASQEFEKESKRHKEITEELRAGFRSKYKKDFAKIQKVEDQIKAEKEKKIAELNKRKREEIAKSRENLAGELQRKMNDLEKERDEKLLERDELAKELKQEKEDLTKDIKAFNAKKEQWLKDCWELVEKIITFDIDNKKTMDVDADNKETVSAETDNKHIYIKPLQKQLAKCIKGYNLSENIGKAVGFVEGLFRKIAENPEIGEERIYEELDNKRKLLGKVWNQASIEISHAILDWDAIKELDEFTYICYVTIMLENYERQRNELGGIEEEAPSEESGNVVVELFKDIGGILGLFGKSKKEKLKKEVVEGDGKTLILSEQDKKMKEDAKRPFEVVVEESEVLEKDKKMEVKSPGPETKKGKILGDEVETPEGEQIVKRTRRRKIGKG